MSTENVEMQNLPTFPGFQYTGELRFAKDEYGVSAYSDKVVYFDGPSPAKVAILKKVGNGTGKR